jgi:hypothetical protein
MPRGESCSILLNAVIWLAGGYAPRDRARHSVRLRLLELGSSRNKVSGIEQTAPGGPRQYALSLLKGTIRCKSLPNEVIVMDDPRRKVAAIEAEDARCNGLLNGMAIEVEDYRCESLRYSASMEMEDPRCRQSASEMDDPRCRYFSRGR